MAKKINVCGCSTAESMNAENMIRDLINIIHVRKGEEVESVTTKIEPKTAKELVAKLEKLAEKVGEISAC
ncbi:MAG TPA: hypothetical protein VJG49_04290 [Candidatus Nanoarchaeia archaeon]|nr:hypothetical protein [Candidatus Nanoarchaeia archaeon]